MIKRDLFVKREETLEKLTNVMLEQIELLKYDNKLTNSYIAYLLLNTFVKFVENNYSDSHRKIKELLSNISYIKDNDKELVYVY